MMNLKKLVSTATCGLMLAATLAAGAQIVVRIGPPPPRPVERIPPPPPEHPGWAWHAGTIRGTVTATSGCLAATKKRPTPMRTG